MKTRVYKYGLLRPTGNAALVWEQIRAAHNYRNLLTELERKRRATLRSLLSSYADLDALEQAVAAATDKRKEATAQIKYARSCTRSRSETKAARDLLTAARAAVKQARQALVTRRKELLEDTEVRLQCDEVNAWASAQRRAARAECGCYWGTYLLVEAAMDASSKQPLYDGAEPHDPRFCAWRRQGAVGVQIQKGMAAAAVFGDDTRLRIDSVDPQAWHSPVRGERRRKSRTKLRLRIGSDDRGQPVWATWPMVMHRPLPEEGQIMRAAVVVKRYAGRDRWELVVTVRLPEQWQQGLCGKGMVAVDIGWRALDGGLRVAYWRGDDGRHGQLVLDQRTLDGLTMPAGLRAIRDRVFDQFRPLMAQWRQDVLTDPDIEVPEWFEDQTATLIRWRSTERADRLLRWWTTHRFAGDDFGFQLISAWQQRNQHLWDWEANQRRGSLANRREQYRVFAARLTDRYATVVLEDFNMKQVAQRPRVGEEDGDNERARSNRQLASVHELRLALCNSFARRGGGERRVPAQGTTIACHRCNKLDRFDAAAELQHCCRHCGATWDQDHNAAINMLRLAHEQKKTGRCRKLTTNKVVKAKPEPAAESKWQRVARLRSEKDARQRAAAQ